jgi:hypothetical protein
MTMGKRPFTGCCQISLCHDDLWQWSETAVSPTNSPRLPQLSLPKLKKAHPSSTIISQKAKVTEQWGSNPQFLISNPFAL